METIINSDVAINTTWVMLCAFLVFFMNTGFGCIEAGFCRAKNAVNILSKNFVVFALASISFWAIGFGLMFGDGNSFIGLSGWFVEGADNSPLGGDVYQGIFSSLSWAEIPLFAKFFFQLAFAATAATIVSGCVAERIHYISFMIFAVLIAGIFYPITGHWIWGGGWLQELGFYDFAGSTVVHSVGGWAGLAGILILGPRIGKFKTDNSVSPIQGHSMPLAFLGGMILWLGWFGFNPGSTMAITGNNTALVAHIVITTNLACSAGIIISTLFSYLTIKKPDFSMTVNGALAGLVSITAGCAFVTPIAAILIGSVAGFLVVAGVRIFDRIKIDDPVGALSVHLICGIWGTLALGLFATTSAPGGIAENGLLYGGGMSLLSKQMIGVACVGAFTFIVSYAAWSLIKMFLNIRVEAQVETEGLDIHEMGSEAYPHEQAIDVAYLLNQSKMGRHMSKFQIEKEVISKHIFEKNSPYSIELININSKEFMKVWTGLCGSPDYDLEEFRKIYKYFTIIDGNTLRFRGGDPARVLTKLLALARSINENATAVLNQSQSDIYKNEVTV